MEKEECVLRCKDMSPYFRDLLMREIILYTATSIDNFIAGPKGEIDWLHSPEFEIEGEDFGYADFYASVDTTLMGNNTYKVIQGFDQPFPYQDKTNYVFSRDESLEDTEFVHYVHGDAVEFVKSLKHTSGGNIWLVGGGELNTVLLDAGLIDRIILTLVPVELGEGIPIFQHPPSPTLFDVVSTRSFDNGFLQVRMVKLNRN